MDGDNNVLIYGKNTQQGIVSLEVNYDNLEVFIQDDIGTVTSHVYPYKHKVFSNKPLNKNSKKLDGNLHYQYLNTYDTQESWEEVRRLSYHRGYHVFYNKKEEALVCNGASYFKGLKVKDVSVLSFDIETTGLVHNNTSKVLIISNTFRKKDSEPIRKMFTYDDYSTQLDLLNAWCNWVREIDPSIIVGHNIYSYDLKYMQFIAQREGGDLYLGRNNSPLKFEERASKFRKDASQFYEYNRPHIYGRELCDTFFLALKYDIGRKYDSYGLKQIIKQEGLEIKDRQFYDASQIYKNYLIPEEWNKIKDYAELDADDSLALYDLMIPSYFYITNTVPKPFQQIIETATGSQINSVLLRAYIQESHSFPKADDIKSFQGGISLGVPGIYKNVWKIDIKSCYPSAIIINKLYSKTKDPKAQMLRLCEFFTKQRFEYKSKYKETNDDFYLSLDQAAKVFINSIFGFCSASGLNFNDPDVAKDITMYGREYLNIGMVWATNKNSDYWMNVNEKK